MTLEHTPWVFTAQVQLDMGLFLRNIQSVICICGHRTQGRPESKGLSTQILTSVVVVGCPRTIPLGCARPALLLAFIKFGRILTIILFLLFSSPPFWGNSNCAYIWPLETDSLFADALPLKKKVCLILGSFNCYVLSLTSVISNVLLIPFSTRFISYTIVSIFGSYIWLFLIISHGSTFYTYRI